ncbi:MAG: ankyrin repeat domain-containing protein [Bacteroidales bacterium]|nr:ankyrin repeat domain-containing protein [Bacteroidales bacterium]
MKRLFVIGFLVIITACAPQMSIHKASELGNIRAVNWWIKKDINNINKKDKYNNLPLHNAIRRGHFELVKILIDKGADIESKDSIGNTGLNLALNLKRLKIANYLLKNGAKINNPNVMGLSSLHFAAENGFNDLVTRFLDKGQDVNLKSKDGWTPLHLASGNILKNHLDTIKILLKRGAHINAIDKYGQTPLFLSMSGEKQMPTVKLLIAKEADLNIPNHKGLSLLHRAVFYNNIELIERLCSKGGNINAQDKDKSTPMFTAIRHNRPKIVSLLLSKGASIDIQDKLGNSALHFAIKMDRTDIVREFLKKGANINLKNNNGLNPLNLAITLAKEKEAKAIYPIWKAFKISQNEEITNLVPALVINDFIATKVVSDVFNNVKRITTILTVNAFDVDGGSLKFNWKSSNGSIVNQGKRALFYRQVKNERIVPGIVTLEVTDGQGGIKKVQWNLK